MKGIVNCYLNIRTQKASVNAPNPAFLKPGDVVEIIDIVNGDEYQGNDLWFQLSDGFSFVWSGGISASKSIQSLLYQPQPKVLINYNNAFSIIPQSIRSTNGKGIKVAILDTGVDMQHSAFLQEFKGSFNALTGKLDVTDIIGHGTHCAGLIGARNNLAEKGIAGIAPETELYAVKVATDDDIYFFNNVVKGLKWAIEEVKADIINLSFSILDYKNADKTEFNRLISKAYINNQVLISAAGENDLLLSSLFPEFNYPAFHPEILSVGAIDESIFRSDFNFNKRLDILMPFKRIYSSVPGNGYQEKKGSSAACAVISGIASLYLSSKKDKTENSAKYIKRCLTQIASPLSKTIDLNLPYQIFIP